MLTHPTGSEERRILLRFEEAAKILGLGRSTIYDLVSRGELPVVRVGRAVRIPASALEAWAKRKSAPALSCPEPDLEQPTRLMGHRVRSR